MTKGNDASQHIQFLKKLDELSRQLTSDHQKNIDIIVSFTNEILSATCSLYNKLDKRDDSLVCWAKENTPADLPDKDDAKGHICYEATIKGKDKIVCIPDISKTQYYDTDPYVKKYSLKSYLGFPVKIGGQSLGSLCIVDVKNREFTEIEKSIIEHLANVIRIQEENLKISKIQTVLYKISRTLLTSKDLNDLCEQIKNHLSAIVDSSNFSITLLDDEKNSSTYYFNKPQCTKNLYNHHFINQVLQTGKPQLLNHLEMVDVIPESAEKKDLCCSWVGVPLKINEKIIGVISLSSCRHYLFLDEDIKILEFVSFEIAHILHEKKLKEELKKKEEEYRTIINQSAIGIYRTDLEGNILFVNDALVKMLEYDSIDELMNLDLNSTYHPDYERAFFIQSLVDNGTVTNKETLWKTKKGNKIYVREVARLLDTDPREIIEGTVEDITQEVIARNDYNFEKERFDNLITTVPIGILQINKDNQIIFINDEFEKISGYPKSEIKEIGQFFEIIFDMHKNPLKEKDLDASIKILVDKNGVEKHVKISKTKAIKGSYIISIEDITASIHSQSELIEQSKYISALNMISNKLLSEDILPFRDILEIVGETLSVSEVTIYRYHKSKEVDEIRNIAQWSNPKDICSTTQNLKMEIENQTENFPNWVKKLTGSDYMYGVINDFLTPEKELLEKKGIQSIFVHKIMVNEEYYGIFILKHYDLPRHWTDRDIMFIQTVVNNFSETTAQKLMTTKLKNSRMSYQELFKNSNSGIIIFSKTGEVENINPAAEILFDRSFDEVMGQNLTAITKDEVLVENIESAIKFCNTVNSTKKMDVIINGGENRKVLDLTFKKILYFDQSCVIMYAHDITLRYEKELEIRKNLNEKQTLLQEIHHRVKNNLQIISSLLNLQMKDIETPKDKALFLDSQNRIRSIALIHESLYNSQNLSKINLYNYTEQLINRLYTVFQVSTDQIKYIIDIQKIELNIKLAIPCGLILDELITNSLKYAFPDKMNGMIEISFHRQADNFILYVKDNGVGIDSKNILLNNSTLGFELITTLIKQLKGNFKIIEEKGFGVEITFPAN